MFGDNTARNDKFHRSIVDPMTLVHVQPRFRVLKATTATKTDCQFEGSWGIVRIHAKISPKAASEKAQTTVSGNRNTNPIIDVFRTVVLSLLGSTGNSVRASFLVHQVPRTSATVWRYRRVFTQFSVRVRVSDYTWRPMIAGLL